MTATTTTAAAAAAAAAAALEWSRSTVSHGAPGVDKAWFDLETVWHNTHLSPALRIAEDRRISGGLIYEGKLQQTRTEVVYLTPKTWGGGSIYGSFCFEAVWSEIAKGRKLYWVEENASYQNPISRFLLSWYDVSHLPVTPYDPVHDTGPLRRVGDKWWWLSTTVPEIVVDDPLYTISLLQLKFDTHRDGYCHHTRGNSCREKGVGGSWDAQTSFLARLLADPSLGMEDLLVRDGGFTHGVYGGLSTLYRRLFSGQSWAGPVDDDERGLDCVTAACVAYHLGDRPRAKRLLGMLDAEGRAERLFLEAIRSRFAFPTFNWMD